MSAADTGIPESGLVMNRLDDQIGWYDRKSISNQSTFKWIKVIEILAAAVIPFIGTFQLQHAPWITGSLGVLVTILEGLLHLNQYQQNWINYRSICESLRHEKHLYLAKAGPYSEVKEGQLKASHALLAERIELLISQEQANWAAALQKESKDKA